MNCDAEPYPFWFGNLYHVVPILNQYDLLDSGECDSQLVSTYLFDLVMRQPPFDEHSSTSSESFLSHIGFLSH